MESERRDEPGNIPLCLPQTTFEAAYLRGAEVVAEAPGSVDLFGEPDAAEGGRVLLWPLAVGVRISASSAPGRRVRVRGTIEGEFELGREEATGDDLDLVAGVSWELRRTGLPIDGFDALVESRIPSGHGLGRRAAIPLALLGALLALRNGRLSLLEGLLLAQRAAADFGKRPVRLGHLFGAAFGERQRALFVETRSLEHESVPIPEGVEDALVHSGPGTARNGSGRPTVEHLTAESRRVAEGRGALGRGDLAELGRLLRESRASRSAEAAPGAADRLAALADGDPDALGARVTEDGRGCCVLLLARSGRAGTLARRVAGSEPGATVLGAEEETR